MYLHANDIKKWMDEVRERYDDYGKRLQRYEQQLSRDLGRDTVNGPMSLNSSLTTLIQTIPRAPLTTESLQARIRDAAVEFDEVRRKSARKREYVQRSTNSDSCSLQMHHE